MILIPWRNFQRMVNLIIKHNLLIALKYLSVEQFINLNFFRQQIVSLTVLLNFIYLKQSQFYMAIQVLIQTKNLFMKNFHRQNFDLDLIYYHLSLAYNQIGNKEQSISMAKEAKLLIQQQGQNDRYFQINDLLASLSESNISLQINYLKENLDIATSQFGLAHTITQNYHKKIQSLYQSLAFEQSLDNLDVQIDEPSQINASVEFQHQGHRQSENELQNVLQSMQIKKSQPPYNLFESKNIKINVVPPQPMSNNIYYHFNNPQIQQKQRSLKLAKQARFSLNLTKVKKTKTEENIPTSLTVESFGAISTQATNQLFISKHFRNTTSTSRLKTLYNDSKQHISLVSHVRQDSQMSLPKKAKEAYYNNLMLQRPSSTVHQDSKKPKQIQVRKVQQKRTQSNQKNNFFRLHHQHRDISQDINKISQLSALSISSESEQFPPHHSSKQLEKKIETNDQSLESAAIIIQRYYRQRISIRNFKNKAPSPLKHSLLPSSDKTSESDSVEDIVNIDNVDIEKRNQKLPLSFSEPRVFFRRSSTIQVEQENKYQTNRLQVFDATPSVRNNKPVTRNSVKFNLQPINPESSKRTSIMVKRSSNADDESINAINAINQFPTIEMPEHSIMAHISFYLKGQLQTLWKISNIESNVIYHRSDAQKTQTIAEFISLTIVIEQSSYIGPLQWKVGFDRKLFKFRKSTSIFKFADLFFTSYLQENKLEEEFRQNYEKIKEIQSIIPASYLDQNEDNCIEEFLAKFIFFLIQYTVYVIYLLNIIKNLLKNKDVNGFSIKQFTDRQMAIGISKQQERCKKIMEHYNKLRNSQKIFNIKIEDIILQVNKQPMAIKENEKKVKVKSKKSSLKKLKQASNSVLFAVKAQKRSLSKNSQEYMQKNSQELMEQNVESQKIEHNNKPDIQVSHPDDNNQQQFQSQYSIVEKRFSESQPKIISSFFKKYKKSGHSSKVSFDDNSSSNPQTLTQKSKQEQEESKQMEIVQKLQEALSSKHQKSSFSGQSVSYCQEKSQEKIILTEDFKPKIKRLNLIGKQFSYGPGNRIPQKLEENKRFKSFFGLKKQEIQSLGDFIQSEKQTMWLQNEEINSMDNIKPTKPLIKKDSPRLNERKISILIYNNEPPIEVKQVQSNQVQFTEGYRPVNFFTVNKKNNKVRIPHYYNNQIDYFGTERLRKFHIQYCYLNPFRNNHLIFCSLISKDGTIFLVNAKLVINQEMEQLTQQIAQSKDKVQIKLAFQSLDSKNGNQAQKSKTWDDTLILGFRDFIKWFVEDFNLYQMIVKNVNYLTKYNIQGFTIDQKLKIINNINQNINIQDCKLKLDYFKDNNNKKVKRKYERKDLFIEQVLKLEAWLKRENGSKKYSKCVDQFFTNDPFYSAYFKTLSDQRAKLEKNNQRISKRLISRQQRHISSIFELDFVKQSNNEFGPNMYLSNPDEEFQHIISKEEGTNPIKIPYELQKDLLGQYNSLRQMHQPKYFFFINSSQFRSFYFKCEFKNLQLYEQCQIKIYKPFDKNPWQFQTLSKLNKNKFINLVQIDNNIISCEIQTFYNQTCKLRDFCLVNNLIPTKSIIGMKKQLTYHIHNHENFSQNELNLLNYLIKKNRDLESEFRFLELIKLELLCTDTSTPFWKNYFLIQKGILQTKIRNLGVCLIECTAFIDQFQYKLSENIQPICLIKIKIYKKKDMKTKYWKIALTSGDLFKIFRKLIPSLHQKDFKITDVRNHFDKFLHDLQLIMTKNFVFSKKSWPHKFIIDFNKNRFMSKPYQLYPEFPWIPNFQYNNCFIQPYQLTNSFHYHSPTKPILICNLTRFIEIQNFHHLPAIISIFQMNELNCFLIIVYFLKTQRKFIAQIDFSDFKFKDAIRFQDQQFKIRFSLNLTLEMPALQVTSILQELLYFGVKRLEKNGVIEESLITINIEQNLSLIESFKSIKILESYKMKMFIKLQWLQHSERIQTSILPLPELLIGYYRQKSHENQAFNYSFNHNDLIRLSMMVAEIVSLNWSREHLKQQNFQQIEILSKVKPIMKINASVSLSQIISFQNSQQILMYRGVLMKQSVLAIFKDNENNIQGLVQRLTDGKQFQKKFNQQEIEDFIPGFKEQLRNGNKEELGRKLFLHLKNKMIFQCFCQF